MFHVGQKVVCVLEAKYEGRGYGDEILPEKGQVYTVRAYTHAAIFPAIYLFEIANRKRSYWYGGQNLGKIEPPFPIEFFRPIIERKTDISVFTAMLVPASNRDLVKAKG